MSKVVIETTKDKIVKLQTRSFPTFGSAMEWAKALKATANAEWVEGGASGAVAVGNNRMDRVDILQLIGRYHPRPLSLGAFNADFLQTARIALAHKPPHFGEFGLSRTCFWLFYGGLKHPIDLSQLRARNGR